MEEKSREHNRWDRIYSLCLYKRIVCYMVYLSTKILDTIKFSSKHQFWCALVLSLSVFIQQKRLLHVYVLSIWPFHILHFLYLQFHSVRIPFHTTSLLHMPSKLRAFFIVLLDILFTSLTLYPPLAHTNTDADIDTSSKTPAHQCETAQRHTNTRTHTMKMKEER